MLIRFLSENNEILLVADDKQNVYEQNLSWVNDSMEGLGYKFRGQWNNLKTSIRQKDSPDITKKASEFSNLFLKEYFEKNPDKALGFDLSLITESNALLGIHTQLYWKNIISGENLNNQIYKSYKFLLEKVKSEKDITILLPSVKIGNEVVKFFKNQGIVGTYFCRGR